MPEKVAVIGGGVAGLVATKVLKEDGFEVTSYKQDHTLVVYGRTIMIPPYLSSRAQYSIPANSVLLSPISPSQSLLTLTPKLLKSLST